MWTHRKYSLIYLEDYSLPVITIFELMPRSHGVETKNFDLA